MFRVIVHPTDFSPLSEYAFHAACSLARDHGGRIIVVHVAVPPVVGYGQAMTAPPEGDWQALEAQLSRIQAPDGTVPVEHRLLEGDPGSEIVRVARESNCDLIVMGTHGRTGIVRFLMGSVAEKVLRQASCPVMLVKAPMSP